MRIGLTFDLKTDYRFRPGDPKDANAEFDHPDTLDVIAEGLASLGHAVERIGNARALLRRLETLDVELVFNIAEGYTGRNREAQVPILLEMRGVPYVGADGLTQALTLDKWMTKRILRAEGIPTPDAFQIAKAGDPLPENLAFPLIVKPRFEGSSKGLSEDSVVHCVEDLRARADWVIRTYRQPALAEAFVSGTEYTVALIGNDPPEIFAPVQIRIDGRLELGDLFYTHARIASGIDYVCPAPIDEALACRLRALALRTYRAVDCVDFGRVDFRVDAEGVPYVLEINPLPSLSTEDVFMAVAKAIGVPYAEMLRRIVEAACRRHGLPVEERVSG